MFKICVSQVQLCLLVSDCSRRCFWPLLSHSSVLNLTRTVFLSRCLSGKEGEAAMASHCQLALCHVIVVKWECNNCNNMILAQFETLQRQSFYLRGGERRISVWLCVLQSAIPAVTLYPSNLACGKPGAFVKAAASFTLIRTAAAGRRPPKCSLSPRVASELLICFSQLSVLFGICTVDGFVSARRRWSTRTVRMRGK